MTQKLSPDAASLMDRVARLVVKDGVTLGKLSEADRSLALAWVWAGLPAAEAMKEADVNAQLKQSLQGPARCLDTDHVELRRWLVDGGWLARDGYGRCYQRVPAAELPAHQTALGKALEGTESTAWVEQLRLQRDTERQARHHAWQATRQAAA